MKNRYVVVLCGFLVLSGAVGWLLGRFAPEPSLRRSRPPVQIPSVPPPELGHFYSVDNADGGYRIIQVLNRSPDSIDVRLYGNHFSVRPASIDKTKLTLEPGDGYAGPGFDSLSMTYPAYAAWKPVPAFCTTLRP
jgi:hypothetical protein